MKVYEVTFDSQRDPQNYGLFSSLEKAEYFLNKECSVKVETRRMYPDHVYYDGGFVIRIRNVQ